MSKFNVVDTFTFFNKENFFPLTNDLLLGHFYIYIYLAASTFKYNRPSRETGKVGYA